MQRAEIGLQFPSQRFEPRIYGVGAWTDHLAFAYDLVAALRPQLLVELGTDRGESYFAFCQSVIENQTGTKCFAIDSWRGDAHVGGYDETTFEEVAQHNRKHYQTFSTLLRRDFDQALPNFSAGTIDLLHLDGLHTESAVRHDLDCWLPKLRSGGILLLHDIGVRSRDFGVWKVWDELVAEGRSATLHDGPGLGVWQKPPEKTLPSWLDNFFSGRGEVWQAIENYYRQSSREFQARIAQHWSDGSIRETAFANQTVIQVFFSGDGTHREEDSIYARVGHGGWKEISLPLPHGSCAGGLRIDFVSALTSIELAEVKIADASGNVYFHAQTRADFEKICLSGDAVRQSHPEHFQFEVTGIDPQLYLPPLSAVQNSHSLILSLRLRVSAGSRAEHNS